MPNYRDLKPADLQKAYSYDTATGAVFSRSGRRVGFETANGCYRAVQVGGFQIREHILIWALVMGEWPSQTIDHRNRDGLDNRWDNLRQASAGQQQANRRAWAKSGVRGVSLHKTGKWRACVTKNGKGVHLGLFSSLEDAAAVVQRERERTWHEFACG